jgi:anti-sigma B factor antagonist
MPCPALTVDVSRAGPVDVIAPCGDLDIASAGLLSDALLEQLRRSGAVVLDLRDLAFVDSGGLHALLTARRRAQLLPADLAVACVPPRVRRLLDLTGSTPLFETYASRDAAVAELTRRRTRQPVPPAQRRPR